MTINLSDITRGMPGITPAVGEVLLENGVVMLHQSGHHSPTDVSVNGMLS